MLKFIGNILFFLKSLKMDKSGSELLSSVLVMPIMLVLCRYYNLYKIDLLLTIVLIYGVKLLTHLVLKRQNKFILCKLALLLSNVKVQKIIVIGFTLETYFRILICCRFGFTFIFFVVLKWAIYGTDNLFIQSFSAFLVILFFAARSLRKSHMFTVTARSGSLSGRHANLEIMFWIDLLNHWKIIFRNELQQDVEIHNSFNQDFVFLLPKRAMSMKQWLLSANQRIWLILSYSLGIALAYLV